MTVAEFIEGLERQFNAPVTELIDRFGAAFGRKVAEVVDHLKRREKEFRILYLKPFDYQREFFESSAKVQAVFGGNFSGKTLCGLMKGASIALGIHPTLSGDGEGKIAVPNRGRVMASDFAKGLGEDVEPVLLTLIPSCEIKAMRRNQSGFVTRLSLVNGSVIDFVTYDQYAKDEKVGEGWKGDWAMFNEPPPEGLYKATLRGLMRGGMVWFCCTPLSEPWMYDQIYLSPNCKVWTWATESNPTLSAEQIEDFKARLTRDEIETRIYGRFQHISGLVYKTLNAQCHIVRDFSVPKDWTRYMAIDWHPRKPVSAVWCAVDPTGRVYFYDELVLDGTVEKIASVIKAKEEGQKIRLRYIDWLSAMPDRVTGRSPRNELARHGIFARPAVKKESIGVGIRIVQEYLETKRDGPGCVFFERGCQQTFRDLSRYRWSDCGRSEKPEGEYADLPDCVRYLLTVRPKYINPEFEAARYRMEDDVPYEGVEGLTGYRGIAEEVLQ